MHSFYALRRLGTLLISAVVLGLALLGSAVAWGQGDLLMPPGPSGFGFGEPQKEEPNVTASAEFVLPEGENPGGVAVTATIKPGWHIYSITQAAGGPLPSKITLKTPQGVEAGPFRALEAPKTKVAQVFDGMTVEYHGGTITWLAPLKLASGIDPSAVAISGQLFAQVCDDAETQCLPPRNFDFVGQRVATAAWLEKLETPQVPSAATGVSTLASTEQVAGTSKLDPEAIRETVRQQAGNRSLWSVLPFAFLGGLILNIMPCVFPVIGLKVMSFVEQSGHNRAHALALNIWYALGLLSVFWVLAALAAFLGFGWGELFTYEAFGITLAALVFAMALSFLGVWEIPIPGFVGRGGLVEAAEREGFAGAATKGVLTTLLATPCTAPFLAPAIQWTSSQSVPVIFAVFTSAGLGMASPYLLLGAFPELLRFLPRPGEWMETFKQVMGFVLLGTVVFILTFLPMEYVVPTVTLMFGLWGACWWIGRTPPTADTSVKSLRWLQAVAFAAVIWVIAFPGWGALVPERLAFGGLVNVMRDRFLSQASRRLAEAAEMGPGEASSVAAAQGALSAASTREEKGFRLPWQPYTRRDLDAHIAANRTVLVEFTADWCLTCKGLEAYVLNTEGVQQRVQDNGVVTLKADWTNRDPEVTEMLVLLTGAKQVPTLAIFPAGRPNEPIVFDRGGYTQQDLLEALDRAGASKGASPAVDAAQPEASIARLPM
ncbi:MAG: cytochrome c biogenesis protein CcdA [Planctomycetota bacterium]